MMNKEFIFNYLSGKSTALQKQLVDEWAREAANEELFYQWLVEYECQQPQYLADVQKATGRFRAYADRAEDSVAPNGSVEVDLPRRSRPWAWLVAASVATAAVAGGILARDEIMYQTHRTAYGETKTLILSDSTQVVLNANSSLRVPRFGFGQDTREVRLTGEANFDVAHRPADQKFVVKTDKEFEIVVLGTEFTVYARPARSKVILNKGKVQFNYREGRAQKQVLMQPGDLVTLDARNHLRREVTAQPEKYAAWEDHRFLFDDTTLAEFTEIMHENYGIRVLIEDKNLARRTLVGSFRAESPDELLEIVSRVFNVRVIRVGEEVRLAE